MKEGDKRATASTVQLGGIIQRLRSLMPTRALALHEHMLIAERQAYRLHYLLGSTGPSADLTWVTKIPNVTIVVQPRWKMSGISGLTTFDDGHWVIGVNQTHPYARRRFTLAHELKHLMDANRDKITYAKINDYQRELIANYFAACYLMPMLWVRKAWTSGIQDTEALAGLFKVSVEAMDKRLRYLGFVGNEPERPVTSYFRLGDITLDTAA